MQRYTPSVMRPVDLLILQGREGGANHRCNQLLFTRPYQQATIITLTSTLGHYTRRLPAQRPCQGHYWALDARCTPDVLVQVIDRALAQRWNTIPGVNCTGCVLRLTPREQEVVQALVYGRSYAQVASMLSIHIKTVSIHKCAAMHKLGFRRTQELHQWAIMNLNCKTV